MKDNVWGVRYFKLFYQLETCKKIVGIFRKIMAIKQHYDDDSIGRNSLEGSKFRPAYFDCWHFSNCYTLLFSESGWKTFITLPKFQFLSLGERLYFSQTVLVIDWLNFSPHLFFLFFSSSSSFSIARISKKMLLTSYSFQHHKVHLNNWHESKKDYIDLVFFA